MIGLGILVRMNCEGHEVHCGLGNVFGLYVNDIYEADHELQPFRREKW